MITEKAFNDSAKLLGVNSALIKAIAQVESGGPGFIDEKPVILYEPHVMYRCLKRMGINPEPYAKAPETADIVYPKWKTRPYPKGQEARYNQLRRAVKINREAAIMACSWGKFQLLGEGHKLCGCETILEFLKRIRASEDEHLNMFIAFNKSKGLDKILKRINTIPLKDLTADDFAPYAQGYNGKYYYLNKYHHNMLRWYIHFSKQLV